MPAPLSIDLRQRIIAAYEAKEGSQRQLTKRFKVSLSFIRDLMRHYPDGCLYAFTFAILPLVMIWFGLMRLSIVLVIAHVTTWLIALNTDTGLRTVNSTVLMVERNLGRSGINLVKEILLLAALPYILTGIYTAWAFGWRTTIAAELVFGVAGSEGGLGWYINNSRYFLQTSNVFAGLVVIAVLGLAVNILFRLIERQTVEKWGMKQ